MSTDWHFRTFCLEVTGDHACFTRPELKAERVSYDVITPSAARGIFEALFWKPAIRWQVKRIEVLRPIRWISVRRNEVGTVMSDRSRDLCIEDQRQQRAGLFLRDVAYRLHAELQFIPPAERANLSLQKEEETCADRRDENPGKYNAIFERRARQGQCFNQPYLGCREFSCFFRLIDDTAVEEPSIDVTQDLGFMLYDLDYSDPEKPSPVFFRAHMKKGVIEVPDWTSKEVKR